jgi:heavy metal sensor kinase
MNFSLNIKTRLTLGYLVIIALILVFFSLFAYFLLSRSLNDISQRASTLTVIPPRYAALTSFSEMDISPQPLLISNYLISREWLEQLKKASSSTLSIYTPLGQITINQGDFITPEMQGEQQVQLFLQPSAGNPGYYEVLASVRPVEVDAALAAFTRTLLFAIPATAVLAAGFGFLLIRRMLKPVNVITRTARDIQEKDLSRRIEVEGNDELGKLAATLNQTFERLQKAFQRERQFTSDASHELRTPLSIMQSEATLALKKDRSKEEYRKSLLFISQEITHMSSIINKLLVLSRIDNGKENLCYSRTGLSELLSDLAADIEVLCEEKTIHFKADLQGDVFLDGDEVKLRELFLNLLDNAIKFTPSGGSISLTLISNEEQAVVSVSDNGIGMSEEHLPHIFERFYRIDKTPSTENTGSGLGLAICRHIAELHRGQIQVKSAAGAGSTFRVFLPVAGSVPPVVK